MERLSFHIIASLNDELFLSPQIQGGYCANVY